MVLRVAQWGTGLVGAAAVRAVVEHVDLELVACFAHSPDKVNRDVGEIVGTAPLGVVAVDDVGAVIAARPDCVLYMPLVWDVAAMATLLEAGINVISTANFITGRSYGPEAVQRLEAAARAGGASLYGTGINPGLADVLALLLSANSDRIERVSVLESVDATLYASPDSWRSLGFGGPPDVPGLSDVIRERTLVFVDAVELIAEGLGEELEDVRFTVDYGVATEDLDLGWMHLPRGTVCGLFLTYRGVVRGREAIELGMMWRVGHAMSPDWQAQGYVVDVVGRPSVHCVLTRSGDLTDGGDVTAMTAVHAVTVVCAARPGIVRAHELPLVTARHGLL